MYRTLDGTSVAFTRESEIEGGRGGKGGGGKNIVHSLTTVKAFAIKRADTFKVHECFFFSHVTAESIPGHNRVHWLRPRSFGRTVDSQLDIFRCHIPWTSLQSERSGPEFRGNPHGHNKYPGYHLGFHPAADSRCSRSGRSE